jgi:hypothetical protein
MGSKCDSMQSSPRYKKTYNESRIKIHMLIRSLQDIPRDSQQPDDFINDLLDRLVSVHG